MKINSKPVLKNERVKKCNTICQFIVKLQEMMKSYPDNVKWSQDGENICFVDLNVVENQVIPCFFRHRNMLSFVRQLNMYYFSKLDSEDGTVMKFRHHLFRKGNEDCFYLIGRRNKTRDEIIGNLERNYAETLQILQNQQRISEETKSLIRVAIQYHSITLKSLKKIKGAMEQLTEQMKTVRSKEIKTTLLKLREESMDSLCHLIEQYKVLDNFIKETLFRDLNTCTANNSNSREILPYSELSQPFLLEEARTIKDVEINKGFQSEYSILNFKSGCSLEKNFKEPDDLEDNQQISFEEDLKDDNYGEL